MPRRAVGGRISRSGVPGALRRARLGVEIFDGGEGSSRRPEWPHVLAAHCRASALAWRASRHSRASKTAEAGTSLGVEPPPVFPVRCDSERGVCPGVESRWRAPEVGGLVGRARRSPVRCRGPTRRPAPGHWGPRSVTRRTGQVPGHPSIGMVVLRPLSARGVGPSIGMVAVGPLAGPEIDHPGGRTPHGRRNQAGNDHRDGWRASTHQVLGGPALTKGGPGRASTHQGRSWDGQVRALSSAREILSMTTSGRAMISFACQRTIR